jgi:ATP-dependent Zn protease
MQVSNGASDDLSKLRGMARAMILRYGMSELFPNYAPTETEGQNIFSE